MSSPDASDAMQATGASDTTALEATVATLEAAGVSREGLPRHIAVIMDGNGRWASARGEPRHVGHRAGLESARAIVNACAALGVEALTLFAFSSENWRRPEDEVSRLMSLFDEALNTESEPMHEQSVRLSFAGDRSAFSEQMQAAMESTQAMTAENEGLHVIVAVNYGGRWDLLQAAQRLAEEVAAGTIAPADIDEAAFAAKLSLSQVPPPDLFIRTGGEQRLSNFLLWDLAYTELHFTETLWPDFDADALGRAIAAFQARERRFGHTGEQLGSAA